MPFLNQFLYSPNARTPAGAKTYATTIVSNQGSPSTSGSAVTFSGLNVQIDGTNFTQSSTLDFANLGSLVSVGGTYGVYAVPQYNEPASQSAAEAAGLNYYVTIDPQGQGIATRFLPSEIITAINDIGGINALKDIRLLGQPTQAQITLYNRYYEVIEQFNDPKYVTMPLLPIGYNFVISNLMYLDNSSKVNAFLGMDQNHFNQVVSQLGQVYSLNYIFNASQATSRYGNALWLIKRAVAYGSQSDALTANNPTDVTAAIQTALANGTTYTFSAAWYSIDEYTITASMDIGQTRQDWNPTQWYTSSDSSYLGRINPIYLDPSALFNSARLPKPAMSRLTQFAAPCSLARVTIGAGSGGTGVAISNITYTFDTGF